MTAVYGGSALTCGTCCGCYGFDRPDCFTVWCSGYILSGLMSMGYGYAASCLIGLKMCGMLKWVKNIIMLVWVQKDTIF